ncbi:MipA/OmpV family protein [Noviherbaspirillum aridicola]|uniref:Outer membrane scaffolding protein for murein synthesis (MipA/OmpV family) n=1 Tax=Noviherbaspirillum aridicola TaxID=2849687 RepID=A0ABQ4Q781_9BURK|nr:MipA/OmpV family protein [Noviherbaspirillum aridicola]GIZ52564.1 hypothetical protein NCCP691_25780 [Noviherbaspirillum aridicola]
MTKTSALTLAAPLTRATFPSLAMAAAFCAVAGTVGDAAAETLPLWEVGAGVGALVLPEYRGSDQERAFVLPTPYFVYRGEHLKADRNGVRAELLDSERVDISLSLNATLPVSSDDNEARRGMPDLRPTVEMGGNASINLWKSANGKTRLDLRLPLRAAVTVESSPKHIGWVFSPNLNIDIEDPAGFSGWRLGMLAGPLFSTRKYNAYFYSVSPAQALPDRPAYSASGGYSGTQFTTALSKRFPRYWVGAFLRYDNLRGASFEDSPLVLKHQSVAAGVAINWIFGESSQRVEADE